MKTKMAIMFVASAMCLQAVAANYTPTSSEQRFADYLSKQSFAKAVAWSQQGSLWVSVINSPGSSSSLYERLANGICSDGKGYGLNKFFVHIWDAQAMVAGNMKRLTDKVYCK
jgi:hypothetical protein